MTEEIRDMADAIKIRVEARDPAKNKGTGTRVSRKLRKSGRIPAIVYGHKQAPTTISLTREAVLEMIKKQTHLAELDLNGVTETVLVREVQWCHLGKDVLHLDFARVNPDEAIETEVTLDVRGTAPGVAEGGQLEILIHSVQVRCSASAIPDSIKVDVSGLGLGKAIHIRELVLPTGVTAVGDPEMLLIHVSTPKLNVEPDADVATQPVVIKAERKEKAE